MVAEHDPETYHVMFRDLIVGTCVRFTAERCDFVVGAWFNFPSLLPADAVEGGLDLLAASTHSMLGAEQ